MHKNPQHNEINHMQFSNFYCPSKEELYFKSTSQSELRLSIFTKVFEVQHYRASHTIASFHRNETDQTKSVK